jgi:MFS superfamily sulfate permease-like transporter
LSPSTSPLGSLRYDIPASVVVFLVALPLCLGIALASGAPLIAGIIAGVVGGIVVGGLSGSHTGVAGPAAGLAVVVLTAIEELGSYEIFLVAVVLAGILQMVLGYLRAGIIGYYFPSSVIKGMLAGIGVLIFLKQIPHALGYDKEPEGSMEFAVAGGETTLTILQDAIGRVSVGPLVITAVALAILILWETKAIKGNRVLSLVPGPLLAVVVGVVLGLGFGGNELLALSGTQLVSLPVAEGLGDMSTYLTFPNFGEGLVMPAVYKAAGVIAVVASLETLLCVEATDKLDPFKRVTPTNRELKAQGAGNLISGLIGGLPVTQVIVRSSANIQAGGRTKASAVIHGVLLLVGALALPTVLNLIPLATLAAILLIVGYKLAKPSLFAKMYSEGRGQFVPFVVTVVGIVFTDLLVGIGIGMAVAVFALLWENYSHPYRIQVEEGGTTHIALSEQVSFLNKASVLTALASIPDRTTVVIDVTASRFLHHDVQEIIENFIVSATERELDVTVLGLDANHEDLRAFVDSSSADTTHPSARGAACNAHSEP